METQIRAPRTRGRAIALAAAVVATAAALCGPSAASAATQTFTNPNPIAIPQQGQGNPYPSTIGVAGLGGIVQDVNATITGFSHEDCQPNVDLLLVGPGGQRTILLSDSGRCDPEQQGFLNTITFDDEAATGYGCNQDLDGSFRPTDDGCGAEADDFTPTGPAGPYPVSLTQFDGGGADGTWSLFALDDSEGSTGGIASWSLTITTADPEPPSAAKCAGRTVTILGTKGADTLRGTPGADVIMGRAGNDRLEGLAGDDVICGGRGRDTLIGGAGDDLLIGGAGRDSLDGGGGDDRLFGGTRGAPAKDAIDSCRGRGGADRTNNCERGSA